MDCAYEGDETRGVATAMELLTFVPAALQTLGTLGL